MQRKDDKGRVQWSTKVDSIFHSCKMVVQVQMRLYISTRAIQLKLTSGVLPAEVERDKRKKE